MKSSFLRFSVFFLSLLATATGYSQAGTTITYVDNLGTLTLTYDGQVNGKASYTTNVDNITVAFQNGRWEIWCCNNPVDELLFTSSVTTTNNPPNFSVGNWQDADGGDGSSLSGLSGSGTTGTILPVELAQFTGQADGKINELLWSTASEDGNDRFVVERSAGGQEFTAIGAVSGQGTSNRLNHYRFTDEDPLPGTAFYRLRQVDFDGGFSLSPVVSIRSEVDSKARELSLFPNPIYAGSFQIRYFSVSNGTAAINLFSPDGRSLYAASRSVTSGWNTLEIEAGEIEAGVAFLRVTNGEKSAAQKVLVK